MSTSIRSKLRSIFHSDQNESPKTQPEKQPEHVPVPLAEASSAAVEATKKMKRDAYYNDSINENAVLLEGIGMNPRGSVLYLLRELSQKKYENLQLYITVREDTMEQSKRILHRNRLDHVIPVVFNSEEYAHCLFSCRYLFNEGHFPVWWIKKPGQVYVNVWHGTPLKKLGKKKENGKVHLHARADRSFSMADYMLFPNDYSRQHVLVDSAVEPLSIGREVRLGYPRTGVLFDPNIASVVRKDLMGDAAQTIAWMPTWREGFSGKVITDFLREMDDSLEDDQLLLVNLHPKTTEQKIDYDQYRHIMPFPEEFDTYEVLAAIDVLVTDYSSVFYDFAVTGRKIVLFCPDADEYLSERGLYIDLHELPFPITQTVEQLLKEIREPIQYQDAAFRQTYNSRDSIDNTKRLCEIVFQGIERAEDVGPINEEEQKFTFIVSDGFQDETATEKLYELKRSGQWSDEIFLSFNDRLTNQNKDKAYPLLYEVPTFSTGGKPLDQRSERQRLYHSIPLREVILLDTMDDKRIRSFARFPEPTILCITEGLYREIRGGQEELLEAVRVFARKGDGIFTFSEEIARGMKEWAHIDVHHATSLAEVLDGSFLQEKEKEYKID